MWSVQPASLGANLPTISGLEVYSIEILDFFKK